MKIIEELLDIIFPPRRTELLIKNALLTNQKLKGDVGIIESIRFLTRYEDALVAAAIRENKFFNNTKAAQLLGDTLNTALLKFQGDVIIIPIPLSKKRLRERGHNQVETIAKFAKVVVRTDILERTVHTAPQTSLDKSERLKNIVGAFSCMNPEKLMHLENTTFILLDDVATTGATLKSARVVLEPVIHPSSKLICLAIAH